MDARRFEFSIGIGLQQSIDLAIFVCVQHTLHIGVQQPIEHSVSIGVQLAVEFALFQPVSDLRASDARHHTCL